mmetsp:Transcript_12940/g.15175  ORF Transcript_12940/g.15175 Transcript_12940/m.15175 type:complete len:182 (-) Transcript_12940:202-747(-)|eukprot:CAMPEP_0198251092 /NCGR_PEP_ID=MMETSP1447-20131203/2045_1 /TAXON_ID=420782 /ORGANISM="Chaetoceros dichaeta, Strain CCMP1751" /LENGTH=181 /DNA_ID=CAMNT_0043936039 /DNA_START=102 /DNA_END=647 /DNA_ORIENTATION=+
MKLSLLIAALIASTTTAFAPGNVESTSTALNMDRRVAFGQIAAAGAAIISMPSIASADGSVSATTIQRAKGIYGSRIADLKGAVEAGDFAAVASEKNAFILYNSGAYPKNKPKKAIAVTGTNAIFAAIRAGDKAALKTAYGSYVTANGINGLPDMTNDKGQGFSNDFDFKRSTKAGSIYQR